FPSSKWQCTSSITCCRRVSNVSASVKMDSPKARAVKPPSTDSSITKMISFISYRSKAPLYSARFSANSQERSGEQSARRRGHSESLRESLTFEFPLQRFNDSTNHAATASLIRTADLLPLLIHPFYF